MEEEAADGDDDGAEAAAAAAAAAAAMVDDNDEEVDGWPRLNGKVEPPMPKEPLMMGPRPRHEGNSIYPKMAVLPASFNQYLRPYQKEGIAWLWRQYSQNRGGILGDEMGLGKTVQTIGFISAVLGKTCTREDRDRGFPLAEGDCRQVLVVAPTSTLANWHREFTTWGCFRVRKCHGAEKEEALRAAARRECEVVLTTYGMVLANAEELAAVPWEVTIWDEVHTIKNHKSKTNIAAQLIPCCRRYGLTGTPMSNDYQELWQLFDFVSCKKVGEKKDFNQFYSRALKDGQQRLARQDQLATRLRRQEQLKALMDRWMLQRFKTIISDQLPKKEDTIVFCEMAARQKRVYKRVLESPDYVCLANREEPCACGSGELTKDCHGFDPDGVLWQAHHIDENGEVMESCPKCEGSGGCSRCIGMPAITKLMRIANHLELLKPDERNTCKKCGPCRAKQFDACEKTARELAFARMAMGQEHSGSLLRDASFLSQSSDSHCGKMQTLKQLLRMWHKKQQKVLLFSYSTQMLDILEDFVTRLAYSHLRLDGSTPQARRQKLVDEFNSTPASQKFLFLLSTKAGGLGINLVSATVVVVFDPNWNPSHDMQAQDRAYRIGQRHDVKVFRLMSSNSVEEKIYQRQLYKQGQEGVALHQRDENRYFDAVHGRADKKGELFGMKNLLAFDATKVAGTSGGAAARAPTKAILEREKTKANDDSAADRAAAAAAAEARAAAAAGDAGADDVKADPDGEGEGEGRGAAGLSHGGVPAAQPWRRGRRRGGRRERRREEGRGG